MFILISMNDNTRELTCQEFSNREDAWKAMKEELVNVNNAEFQTSYENDCNDKGYVEDSTEYGIGYDSAWANADDGDLNCDWKIFSINNN